MIPLFIGFTAANLILLSLVFGVGLFIDAEAAGIYRFHVGLGIAAGLISTLTHLAIYTYFMATTRWLQAAASKANLDIDRFVRPALSRKSRAFPIAMAAVVMVMFTMFSGAAADASVRPWWPGEVHMTMAALAIAVNVLCALGEYKLITGQGQLMDEALVVLNMQPSATTPPPAEQA